MCRLVPEREHSSMIMEVTSECEGHCKVCTCPLPLRAYELVPTLYHKLFILGTTFSISRRAIPWLILLFPILIHCLYSSRVTIFAVTLTSNISTFTHSMEHVHSCRRASPIPTISL